MKIGDSAKISGFLAGSESNYKRKLLAMGLTKGTQVQVTKKAPLGDPVELEVRGYRLSLRKDEAAVLELEGLK